MTLGLKLVNYLLILPVQSVLPLCATFTAYRLLAPATLRRHPSNATFFQWFLHRSSRQVLRLFIQIELFTAIYYYVRRRMLQRKPLILQYPQSAQERRTLAKRCLQSIEEMDFDDCPEDDDDTPTTLTTSLPSTNSLLSTTSSTNSVEDLMRDWHDNTTVVTPEARKLALKKASISGWFLGAPLSTIRRGNLEQWVCWAFFLKHRRDITPASAEMQEVTHLVNEIIDWAGLSSTIEPGFNAQVSCIRLDFDPIPSSYRPFIYYLVTYGCVGIATEIIMRHWFGFVKHTSGCLTYWHRPGDGGHNDDDKPIVFCHGLGIGVLSYATVVAELLANPRQRQVSLFMVELPHIAMRPVEAQASPRELVVCIEDLLHVHRYEQAHFVGHSFGTLVLTWVAKHKLSMVSRFTFLDPVCFLLCKHDVAYNFLYKKPTNATEALMSYFVGQELFISYTLSRHFNWQANILWPEQISQVPTTVVLSSNDHIVPSRAVQRHLTSWKKTAAAEGGQALNVVCLDKCGHAGFLLNPVAQTKVVELIAGGGDCV